MCSLIAPTNARRIQTMDELHINEFALRCKIVIEECLYKNDTTRNHAFIAMAIMADLKACGIELVDKGPEG